MRKIFRFETLDPSQAISVDEYQPYPDKVIMRVHQGDDIHLFHFSKDEFMDLAGMRFRLNFADEEESAPVQELSLVA